MITLDCIGLLCPAPIHLAARQLERAPPGALLEIVCDDPTITQDLPSWCRLTGHTIVDYRRIGECHRYVVRKQGRRAAGQQ